MSTNDMVVLIIFFEFETFAKFSNLSSGTGTIPIFGSIVQKGKFAACALLELVNALKRVDSVSYTHLTLPTKA